jgi:hypothetical protein
MTGTSPVAGGASLAPPASVSPAPLDTPRAQPLADVLFVRLAWKGELDGKTHPSFHVHSVEPEPGWPSGRKGLMLASLWKQQAKDTSQGMMICDGDVVIDSADMEAMVWAVAGERDAVHVAPVKLWPCATGLPGWVWGHRKILPEGLTLQEAMDAWRTDIDDPDMFPFGFIWLPARLMDAAIKTGLAKKIYPHVDQHFWQTARDIGVPARVVRGDCHPRHTNY